MTESQTLPTHRGHCPNCNGVRNCDVTGYDSRKLVDDDDPAVETVIEYRILKCKGCEQRLFQRSEWCNQWEGDEEVISHWPAPTQRVVPLWLETGAIKDAELRTMLSETYNALNGNSPVLAAIGVRTSFDRASVLLGADVADSFTEKLDWLFEEEWIGGSQKLLLDVLIEAGNAAAHRVWRPSSDQLSVMMSVLEHFIYTNFVLKADVDSLKVSVPPKPPKKKKAKP